jgi:hypothetical protein
MGLLFAESNANHAAALYPTGYCPSEVPCRGPLPIFSSHRLLRAMFDSASSYGRNSCVLILEVKTRRRYPALALAALLCLAVFMWGLHYKLSLYHTAGSHQTAPAAKLLSQKERPAASFKIENRVAFQCRPQFLSHAIPFHQHWAFLTAVSPEVAGRLQKLLEVPPKRSTRQLWHTICNSARPPPPIAI